MTEGAGAAGAGAGATPPWLSWKAKRNDVARSASLGITSLFYGRISSTFDLLPQSEGRNQAVEMIGMEPQALRGPGDRAAALVDRLDDQPPLEVVQGIVEAGGERVRGRSGLEQRLGQVLGTDGVALPEDD